VFLRFWCEAEVNFFRRDKLSSRRDYLDYFKNTGKVVDKFILLPAWSTTARSVEETQNAGRNPNRNPEWWGDFSQLEIEKLKFLRISRYKFRLKFWLNLNSSVSRYKFKSWFWVWSWLKSSDHSGFRLGFRQAFGVSSSTERAVAAQDPFYTSSRINFRTTLLSQIHWTSFQLFMTRFQVLLYLISN